MMRNYDEICLKNSFLKIEEVKDCLSEKIRKEIS